MRDGDLEMGQGHIPPEQMEAEVRAIRHSVKGIDGWKASATDIMRDAIARATDAQKAADRAVIAANEAQGEVRQLQYDLFGREDRKEDRGILGELNDAIKGMRMQQWAILLLLLSAVVALVGNLASHAIK